MARPTLLEQKEKFEVAPRKPGRPPTTTKEAVLALQHKRLNALAPAVFKRLDQAVNDPADPFHGKAMELLMDRLAPKAYWNAIAEKEVGGTGGTKPQINIVINGGASVAAETIDVPSREVYE